MIGPVLMGLSAPVHVLQRGAEVSDIVNMVAVAVVGAQEVPDSRKKSGGAINEANARAQFPGSSQEPHARDYLRARLQKLRSIASQRRCRESRSLAPIVMSLRRQGESSSSVNEHDPVRDLQIKLIQEIS